MLPCSDFRGPSWQHKMAPFQAQQPSVAVSKLKKIEIAINELGRTRARRKKSNFQKAGGDFLMSNSDSAPPNYVE
jgi:hypothetical protein